MPVAKAAEARCVPSATKFTFEHFVRNNPEGSRVIAARNAEKSGNFPLLGNSIRQAAAATSAVRVEHGAHVIEQADVTLVDSDESPLPTKVVCVLSEGKD